MLRRFSKPLSISIDLIFLKHPERSSLGFMFGVALHILTKIFAPTLRQITWLDLASVGIVEYGILGLVLIHLPTIMTLLVRPTRADEGIEKAFAIMREAKKLGASEDKIGDLCIQLCEEVVKKRVLDEEVRTRLQEADQVVEDS